MPAHPRRPDPCLHNRCGGLSRRRQQPREPRTGTLSDSRRFPVSAQREGPPALGSEGARGRRPSGDLGGLLGGGEARPPAGAEAVRAGKGVSLWRSPPGARLKDVLSLFACSLNILSPVHSPGLHSRSCRFPNSNPHSPSSLRATPPCGPSFQNLLSLAWLLSGAMVLRLKTRKNHVESPRPPSGDRWDPTGTLESAFGGSRSRLVAPDPYNEPVLRVRLVTDQQRPFW